MNIIEQILKNSLVDTKIYENSKSTTLEIPHEHSILEVGLRPLIKYIKKTGKTEVVCSSKFELRRQLAISNVTDIELVDKRKISVVKSYTKTKRGTDVPIYYINGVEYNGQKYKKHMKNIKECYDNKFRPKF